MGIVYLATDTKLNRQVAIKVLPAAVISSQDDRARFFREAQAAAQLHHPHIATVFQIDEAVPVEEGKEPQPGAEPRLFIAMEYIDGETLQQRASRSPLALPEAVSIATQMGEALRTAHAKNIVHRDIKSANVMLTKDGIAKVLDFGLAKTNQSTMLTRMGSTLGTVAYMSPEQARGQEVDGRSDLYSLGTVLYEMIAGRLPFSADYEQAVLYSILNEPPEPLTSVRTGVPMQLEWIVNKLLSKEADYRYQTAADLLADLKSLNLGGSGNTRRGMTMQTGTTVAGVPGGVLPNRGLGWRALPVWIWGIVAAAFVLGVAATWIVKRAPVQADDAVIRASLDLGTERVIGVAVSPSGRLFAWSDFQVVRVRDLQSGEEWEIPESDRIVRMQFRQDEAWLLLDRPGEVLRVQVRGGKPLPVVAVQASSAGAIWGPDDSVVYESAGVVYSLSLAGGGPRQVLPADSLVYYDEPFLTADWKTLIASVEDASGATVGVFDFPSGDLRGEFAIAGSVPIYVPTGHILYREDASLMAVPVNLDPPELVGPPVVIAENMRGFGISITRLGHAFIADEESALEGGSRVFERRYFDGRVEPTAAPLGTYDGYSVSPVNPNLVVAEQNAEDGGQSLWVLDLASGVSNRLTFGDVGDVPSWSPSGDSVLYIDRSRPGGNRIVLRAADGTGEPKDLVTLQERLGRPEASRRLDRIAFARPSGIGILDVRTGEVTDLEKNVENPIDPRLSPDGRFVLYGADLTAGERHVWMQPVPADGSRWDLSRGEADYGAWSAAGDAVYFQTPEGIARVPVSTTNGRVAIGNPEIVLASTGGFELLPDGSGVIVNRLAETRNGDSRGAPVSVIFHWTKELAALAPHPR